MTESDPQHILQVLTHLTKPHNITCDVANIGLSVMNLLISQHWLSSGMLEAADHPTKRKHLSFAIRFTNPQTLFYSQIVLGAAALISIFPSGIQAKRKVKAAEADTQRNRAHFKALMSHTPRNAPKQGTL